MRITFSPQRRDDMLTLQKSGDKLIINDGITLDFSNLADGATGVFEESPSDFLAGPVHRVNGVLELTIVRPHGPNPSQSEAFPQPIVLADGQTIKINEMKLGPTNENN